ncbi:ATPase [Bacteroidia bacterium]|nr:ATPase [Bacteroidia bacterium]
MRRCIINELIDWKNSYSPRMPLVLQGARQIGKTYVLKEFGTKYYENVIYANFDSDVSLRGYFEGDLKPDRIIAILEEYFASTIHPQKTLIVFDEIQECPRALTSLKYFAEAAPQYDIIAAGSLLGVALKNQEPDAQGTSFPVGKVYIKRMYPLNFEEFLWAKQKTLLANEIKMHFANNKKMPAALHNEALELYREYLVVGGMPLVVQTYINNSSTPNFVEIQKLISASYTADMTKYTEKSQGIRNIALYNSIPIQLGNSDKLSNKFVYSAVEKGARTATFKDSVDWLETAGIALKCTKTTRGDVPPAQYADRSAFKLYLSDVGLLSQILKVNRENLQLFNQMYRGAITENYIAMALTQRGHSLYFWETNSNSEVDFVTTIHGAIIPIEVKSSENNRSKSLNAFIQKYKPQYAIRISEKNFGFENDIKSIPLYAAFCL